MKEIAMLLSVILFLLSGLVFIGISLPLIQRRVRPNPWYGLRVPKTLHDERIWYAANEFSGRMLFVAGLFIAGCALLFAPLALIPGIGREGYDLLCTGAVVGSLLLAVWMSFWYLRKL
jgi:uncharacterized membrane protein